MAPPSEWVGSGARCQVPGCLSLACHFCAACHAGRTLDPGFEVPIGTAYDAATEIITEITLDPGSHIRFAGTCYPT